MVIENLLAGGDRTKEEETGKSKKKAKKKKVRENNAMLGLMGRLGIDEEAIDKGRREEIIKNKIMTECVPHQVKQSIDRADHAFGDFLKANQVVALSDFGAAVYFAEPRNAGGAELLAAGRDRFDTVKQ